MINIKWFSAISTDKENWFWLKFYEIKLWLDMKNAKKYPKINSQYKIIHRDSYVCMHVWNIV